MAGSSVYSNSTPKRDFRLVMLHVHALQPFLSRQGVIAQGLQITPLDAQDDGDGVVIRVPRYRAPVEHAFACGDGQPFAGADADRPGIIKDGVDQRRRDLGLINLARPDDRCSLRQPSPRDRRSRARALECSTPCCAASMETRRRTRRRSRRGGSHAPWSARRASPCCRCSIAAAVG